MHGQGHGEELAKICVAFVGGTVFGEMMDGLRFQSGIGAWVMVVLVGVVFPRTAAVAEDRARERDEAGEALYAAECAACHGADAKGNDSLRAPAVAGLPGWYMKFEMGRFKDLARGSDPKDEEGIKMHAVAVRLGEGQVDALAQYIKTRTRLVPAGVPTVMGNAHRGRGLYAELCATCHQADGTGNEAENAPPLIGYQDWYLVAQIEKFKAGLRTLSPLDVPSAKMHGMAKKLDSEQDVRDLMARIRELAQGGEEGKQD